MSDDVFESAAQRYEGAATELERAAAHLRTTAQHFRDHSVPRGCAHAFSALGHMSNARRALDELSALHASRSAP